MAMIQAGEVSFAGTSPFVRLYGLPFFAAMFSAAASKFFVSEPFKVAKELKDFVERKLTFKSSSDARYACIRGICSSLSSSPRPWRNELSSP